MSPLFACAGCGVQIERSVRLYRQQKGRVFCSTCIDRQEAERQQAGLQPRPEAGGGDGAGNAGRP
ncbi:hypothetical protein [Cyanobium sp. NIES-981]|uniref:hypothetical protein n=1 Tax=Cyanobium sp. NIES-981 TaxID=1851505 RepID=UPI0007DDB85B|nr:hypothetical protein [Cyanobium sp. NIES-981]SBO43256.1 protein of unknown function [Cyanobium sp. NIES-981]